MSGSAGRASIRSWSTMPRPTVRAAAGGATSSISTAQPTSSSPKCSFTDCTLAVPRSRGSSDFTAPTGSRSARSRSADRRVSARLRSCAPVSSGWTPCSAMRCRLEGSSATRASIIRCRRRRPRRSSRRRRSRRRARGPTRCRSSRRT